MPRGPKGRHSPWLEQRITEGLRWLRLWPAWRAAVAAVWVLGAAAVLLIPGNPVWDWSETRLPNTVTVYGGVLLLTAATYVSRARLLGRLATLSAGRLRVLMLLALVVLAGLHLALYAMAPGYLRAVSREWGLVEPLTWFCYVGAAMVGSEHARQRQAAGQAHQPYWLLAACYLVLGLEECDWLGLFGGLIGRVHGVYVGSLHDLINLLYQSDNRVGGILALVGGSAGVVVLLSVTGYITMRFVRREVLSPSTLLIFLGLALAGLAVPYDILPVEVSQAWLPDGAPGSVHIVEEGLEFWSSALVLAAALLKYARDHRRGEVAVRR